MRRLRKRHALQAGGLVLATGLALGACTDTEIREVIIEVEKPLYEEVPEGAAGFIGYPSEDDQAAHFSVCGNCHVGTQTRWAGTAHADAWAGLQGSGHAAEFCEECHTISDLGNDASGDVAWEATGDPRYYDVQCESCHGAGKAHVDDPDAAVKPLASAAVGEGTDGNCGDCHEDTHHPFVEEWSDSPHSGSGFGFQIGAGREPCNVCHSAQGALPAWGENANYVEKDGDPLPQVCVVCHDPHDATQPHQLRFPIATTSIEAHLCSQCHNRRTVPDPESSHGLEPHSPESALLIGEAGWFPPGIDIGVGQIRGTHGTDRNPNFCAGCHVFPYTITDAATGEFVWQATGHLFRPIPCVDADGVPLGFETDCELTTSARNFDGCAVSGCHGDAGAALSALLTARGRIEPLVEELHDLLLQVDPNLADEGGEIDPTNPTFTIAEGAFFNMELAEFGNSQYNTDNVIGSVTHNPFLIEALLAGSIEAVEDEYGVMASLQVDLEARVQELVAEYGVRR